MLTEDIFLMTLIVMFLLLGLVEVLTYDDRE
jgi:hypothetical protein